MGNIYIKLRWKENRSEVFFIRLFWGDGVTRISGVGLYCVGSACRGRFYGHLWRGWIFIGGYCLWLACCCRGSRECSRGMRLAVGAALLGRRCGSAWRNRGRSFCLDKVCRSLLLTKESSLRFIPDCWCMRMIKETSHRTQSKIYNSDSYWENS